MFKLKVLDYLVLHRPNLRPNHRLKANGSRILSNLNKLPVCLGEVVNLQLVDYSLKRPRLEGAYFLDNSSKAAIHKQVVKCFSSLCSSLKVIYKAKLNQQHCLEHSSQLWVKVNFNNKDSHKVDFLLQFQVILSLLEASNSSLREYHHSDSPNNPRLLNNKLVDYSPSNNNLNKEVNYSAI